jgi:hypothetical protein
MTIFSCCRPWVRGIEDRHICPDDGERLIESVDVRVRQVLSDELEIPFVEQRRLHRDRILAVDEGRDFDIDELDRAGGRRGFAGRCVKGHWGLRLARPAPEKSGGGQQGGGRRKA